MSIATHTPIRALLSTPTPSALPGHCSHRGARMTLLQTAPIMSIPAYFDAHNHIHLSMPGRIILPDASSPPSESGDLQTVRRHAKMIADCTAPSMCGCSVMSTQPRDFLPVRVLCRELEELSGGEGGHAFVPSFGVHPWFLHLANDDAEAYACVRSTVGGGKFWWEGFMREFLVDNPSAAVGEIGLDGARYDPVTRALVTPMEKQVEAFELQLRMAVELERPVSIHAVRAWKPLLDTLRLKFGTKEGDKPPRMYFHAFGGKPAVVDQLNAACRGTSSVIYGFAPCVNFRSPKTAEVVRKIGIDSLVLESDRESYREVSGDLKANAEFIANVLDLSIEEVINKTTSNALKFYGVAT